MSMRQNTLVRFYLVNILALTFITEIVNQQVMMKVTYSYMYLIYNKMFR